MSRTAFWNKTKNLKHLCFRFLAERWGFEPQNAFDTLHDFQSCALLKEELKSNREKYEDIVAEFQEDERLSALLAEHDLKIRIIPEDSLRQFALLMGHIRSFTYTQNALDILKSSMLMQKISDKELLLQLTEIYEVLDGFKATMNGYYDMKDQVMTPFNLTLTDEQMHCLYEGGYEAWDIYLSNISVRNFVRVAHRYFTPDYIERVGKRIDRAIQAIEEKYHLE